MAKVNHSAGDTATASSTASLPPVPAIDNRRLGVALLNDIASLVAAAESLMAGVTANFPAGADDIGDQCVMARAGMQQVGWLVDQALKAAGASQRRGDDWLLPSSQRCSSPLAFSVACMNDERCTGLREAGDVVGLVDVASDSLMETEEGREQLRAIIAAFDERLERCND
jgi:hypothetical protein